METIELFKVVIMIQLFYGLAITGITYALPADALLEVQAFSDISSSTNFEEISSQIEDSVEQQINMPVIELGALVFYSGNIIIDMVLNSALAIPEMFTILVNGICRLISLDSYITSLLMVFAGVVFSVMYFIGIIQLLMNVRSGRVI